MISEVIVTLRDLVEAVQAQGQVRVSRVVLEDAAVPSGPAVDSQTGVFVPARQRLRLRLLPGAWAQAGAAGAQPPQDELTDPEVEAQNHDVDAVDQQQAGGVVPAGRNTHYRCNRCDRCDDITSLRNMVETLFSFRRSCLCRVRGHSRLSMLTKT